MKPEPLINKVVEEIEEAKEEVIDLFFSDRKVDERDIEIVFYHLKKNILEDVKSACEFYLRYKDNPELLWNERKKYRKQMKNLPIMWFDVKIKGEIWFEEEDIKDYNEWLFKLAFRDVFENDD